MTLRKFIRRHRKKIDEVIAQRLGDRKKERYTDEERRQWVYGDDWLYHWAKRKGVAI